MFYKICEIVSKTEPPQLGSAGCLIKVIVYSKIEYVEFNHRVE